MTRLNAPAFAPTDTAAQDDCTVSAPAFAVIEKEAPVRLTAGKAEKRATDARNTPTSQEGTR